VFVCLQLIPFGSFGFRKQKLFFAQGIEREKLCQTLVDAYKSKNFSFFLFPNSTASFLKKHTAFGLLVGKFKMLFFKFMKKKKGFFDCKKRKGCSIIFFFIILQLLLFPSKQNKNVWKIKCRVGEQTSYSGGRWASR